MIICHDSEFVDDGETIELLTIGMVAENGDELYRIVGNADWSRALMYGDEWIRNNVIIPHIPIRLEPDVAPDAFVWDPDHPDFRYVMPRHEVARDVEEFLHQHGRGEPSEHADIADLWAYYPATDHVALYQLFGPMVECTHHGVAMRTSCLKQHEVMLRRERPDWNGSYRPIQDPKTEHHALWDAKHDMDLARWLGLVK